jgi:hypothetical protein
MEPKPMRIEPKMGTKPVAAAKPPSVEELYVRKLDHPYWELRGPDAQANSYLEGNALKLITDDEEEVRRFLADAKLMIDQSTTPKKRSIHYQIDREKYKNLRPMDAIPASELAAFEEAAKAFYDKAAPDRKDVHPYESFLRLNFKLPDPDKEPDAYLVHGDDFERQLLVLWGCEKQRDTSLPLTRHKVVRLRSGEETVADRLRKRVIGWEQMQKDALLLMAKTHEPLFRFIGQPVLDEKGAVKGFKIGEAALPIGKTRPLRYLIPLEMRQFHKACQDFYNRAASATSLYERELRMNFQLPDPDKMPQAFRVTGSRTNPRLIILWDGRGDQDKTIWLTPSPEFNIPPSAPLTPEQKVLGQKPVLAKTLTDKLQEKTYSVSKIIAVASAIVGTPILLALVFWLMLDKSPPKLLDDQTKNFVEGDNAATILVRFNKAIDPDSVPKDRTYMFKLEKNGSQVTVVDVEPGDTAQYKNREFKLVVGESDDFVDNTSYTLTVNALLQDRKLLRNRMKAASQPTPFTYHDNKPPTVGTPSSDGGDDYSKLVVPFSKNLDAASAGNPQNYSLEGNGIKFTVTAAKLDDDQKTVILTLSQKLTRESQYTLTVSGVEDTAISKNTVATAPMPFIFRDTMPPKLLGVAAGGAQNEVLVEFNKQLDPNSATNQSNYDLHGQNGSGVTVYAAHLVDAKKVSVLTAPLSGGVEYTMVVKNIGDANHPPNILAPVPKKFQFTGIPNHGGPTIDKLTPNQDRTKITVYFGTDNPLATNALPIKDNFELKYRPADGSPDQPLSTIENVIEPDYLPDYPGVDSVSLELSSPLSGGKTYVVSAKGLTDIWGGRRTEDEKTFTVRGFSIPLNWQSCKFGNDGNDRSTIIITFGSAIDDGSVDPKYFTVVGATVKKAEPQTADNGKTYAVKLTLSRSIESDTFEGDARVFVPGNGPYADLHFKGPDQSQSR